MLVLSRRCDESIDIISPPGGIPEGTIISVMVVGIRGDKVRLGVDAPVSIPVHRRDVRLAIERERLEAERWHATAQATD